MGENDNFFIGRLKSIKYALKGVWLLITTEQSIMVQFFIAIVMTIVGYFCRLIFYRMDITIFNNWVGFSG